MSYLSFLSFLATLGPKLPQILAIVKEWADLWAKTQAIFATRSLKAKAAKPITAKEAAAEKEVLKAFAAVSRTRGIGDGKLLAVLRQVYEFVKANPALWAILLKMLGL